MSHSGVSLVNVVCFTIVFPYSACWLSELFIRNKEAVGYRFLLQI
jgi:phenolic acid decarboxylase